MKCDKKIIQNEVMRLLDNIESEETLKIIHIFILSLAAHNSDNKKK